MGSRLGLIAVLVSLAAAPAALGDAFDDIYDEYQKTGRIDGCARSEAELESAAKNIPNDIDAYAPEVRNALQAALELRAGGACDEDAPAGSGGGGTTAPGIPGAPDAGTPAAPGTPAPPGATVTPGPTPDPTPAPAATDDAIVRTALAADESGAGTPAPVVALGALGAIIALGGLLYALAHLFAWDPRWARDLRHAVAEAGWRTGNTWAEFADWARPRR